MCFSLSFPRVHFFICVVSFTTSSVVFKLFYKKYNIHSLFATCTLHTCKRDEECNIIMSKSSFKFCMLLRISSDSYFFLWLLYFVATYFFFLFDNIRRNAMKRPSYVACTGSYSASDRIFYNVCMNDATYKYSFRKDEKKWIRIFLKP